MDRRNFIKNLTMVSSAVCAPSFLVNSIKSVRAQGVLKAQTTNQRIAVIVELAGGVDGLNTVIPFNNPFYQQKRPTLRIDQSDALALNDTYGFHPSMSGLYDLFNDGKMRVVHGVGYPNPNRSHFRSRDIWHTAEPVEIATDGWLANYFDSLGTSGSTLGMNVGGSVPKAMTSAQGSSPAIESIDTFTLETDPAYPGDKANKTGAFQQILAQPQNKYQLQQYVTQTALDATMTEAELLAGQDNYEQMGGGLVPYPDSAFGANMKTVAQIIAAELDVQIFYVTIGGFDTHAEQIVTGNSLIGTHASLLADVSGSLKAFYDDLVALGISDQVLIMTFSEFGRRLFENASDGTDHGTANSMFLIGDSVDPGDGFYGVFPSLADADLDPVGDMVHTLDFRSVYATALSYLGADPVPVLGNFPTIPVLNV